jgi:hypothetical protein
MSNNPVTEIAEEVARLNAERRSEKGDGPKQPEGDGPKQPAFPSDEPSPAVPAPTQQEVGPPRFIAVSLDESVLYTSIGNFPIAPDESAAIARVCSHALERELKKTYATIAQHHKLSKSNKLRVVKRNVRP